MDEMFQKIYEEIATLKSCGCSRKELIMAL